MPQVNRNLDDRVDRMEAQLETLAVSMRQVADSMTTLIRVDERVAQMLVENRSMGERLGRTQDATNELRVMFSALRTEVEQLQSARKTGIGWLGQGVFYLISTLVALAFATGKFPL